MQCCRHEHFQIYSSISLLPFDHVTHLLNYNGQIPKVTVILQALRLNLHKYLFVWSELI